MPTRIMRHRRHAPPTAAAAIVLALIVCPPVAAQSPAADTTLASRIAEYTAAFDSADQLSGVLLVARGDSVVVEQAWGKADRAAGAPNTLATPFAVASLTKPMTRMVALQLIDAGRLSPADPIARWLPEFPGADAITVAHLMEHRAGIPHRVTTDDDERRPQTAESMVRLAAAAPLGEPGGESSYSSAGYSVLARVLEVAAGRPYAALLDSLVFAPAGARHSSDATEGVPPGAALAYLSGVDSVLPGPAHDLSFLVGAGSVWSTPRDLFGVMRTVMDGGYGARVQEAFTDEDGIRLNGITDGYRAFADWYPADDLTVIFTGNRFTGAIDALRRDIPRLARGEEVTATLPAYTAVALPSDARTAIEGMYQIGDAPQPLEFVSPSLALLGSWTLIATGPSTFFSPQDYAAVTVVREPDGSAAALQWGKAGQGPQFARTGGLPK